MMMVYSTIDTVDETECVIDWIREHHWLGLVTVRHECRIFYFVVQDTHCFEEPFSAVVCYFHRGHDYLHG